MSGQFHLVAAVVIFGGSLAFGQTDAPPATNAGPFGGVILATPTATLASPAPTAGISDAGRAGISATTSVQSMPGSSTVAYSAGPVAGSGGNASAATNTPAQTISDLGPSFYSDTVAENANIGNANTRSLGEIAAQFKTAKAAVIARTLTNGDVEKMVSGKTGVTMAKSMPPLGPGAMPQSGAALSSAASTTAQPGTAPSGAQAQPNAQSAQSNPSTAQQTGTAENQSTGAESAAAATTPQINRNQQSNDAQGRSKLPATSTLLPLLGFFGLLSGGLGLWFRKFRT